MPASPAEVSTPRSRHSARGRQAGTVTTRRPGCTALLAAIGIGALASGGVPAAERAATAAGRAPRADAPAWLYPLNPPGAAAAPAGDATGPVRVPGGTVTFRVSELNDLYFAPDWRPQLHAPMPDIVARGRAPDVYACGYCHSPSGQGRPENAALAGLPAAYIIQQLADLRSSARRGAWPGAYRPAELMIGVAQHVADGEVAAAAIYFARQQLRRRVIVVERATVPRMQVIGWVYVAAPGAGTEPLGERLLETAPDPARHEHRDDALRYVAYAPPGSIARGRAIARAGGGVTVACVACHGESLRGVGLVPPLAGRSPTYLLRQLVAFQAGTRAGPNAAPMQPVVAPLAIGRMIDLAAYLSSLPP